ncbi:MAG: amino acid adenylation domain-containing protein [Clostridiaceae bacterium]|nr:amino acid adenylation domain-containing protein [Clostridiaceae bacterium]
MKGDRVCYPLTYPQMSIWYLEKLNPGTGIGNIAATMKVDEHLDYDLMNQGVNLLLQKNDGFRIRIMEKEGQAQQYLTEYKPYQMDYFDFSQDNRERLYSWDQEQTKVPFDLIDSDLFYFALIKIDEQTSGFFARIHHLISDAWSLTQIASEIMSFYHKLKNGQPIPAENNPSYLDFIKSEQEYLKSPRYEADRAFWLEQYDRPPEVTSLKNKTTSRLGLEANRKTYILPEKLAAKIKQHCQDNRTSVFALFFSALCIYINRVKNSEHIAIGTPVLNRTNVREKKTIGMFISTVPIQIRINSEWNFIEFSQIIDKEWFSVLKHQKYPFDCLIKDVRDRYKGIDKLFDIALSYQNAKITKDDHMPKQEARWHFNGHQVESLYIHINDREDDGRLILNYDYLTDAFYPKEIDFIHDHIVRLLWHALDNPTRKLAELHMLSKAEMDNILISLNQTAAEYPREATIAQLFEDQARLNPDAAALVFEQSTMTYRELNQRANLLAHVLREKGVGPEVIVGMLLPRSLEMIIGILGIVKAGGAYLPINPEYPADRIAYTLTDSKTTILLTYDDKPADLEFAGTVINLRRLLQAEHPLSFKENPPPMNQPHDLLYIIYTSGSTGKPKGAMIEHRNVVRLLFNDHFQYDFGPDDCWTMFHSYCFDFSVWEMYGALLYGGKLIVVSQAAARDTGLFLDLLKREKVTVLNQTPAAFYNLIEADNMSDDGTLNLRYVIFGGEALKPILLKPFRLRYPDTKLINMYGITETTVHVTFLELSDDDIEKNISNVGRPIPTLKTYILDRRLNPLPIGIPGELCVSGDGVGRGYLNNPKLTAEKFLPNPFCPGETLYRSGDLARYFARGDIEYLGRIDNQVKIRGHRIELGEIESKMIAYDAIKEAVVLTRENHVGNKQLCAYYVPSDDVNVRDLRAFLARYLPEYMVPSYFVRIDRIPLNANGKVDRKSLPEPQASALVQDDYVEPQNEAQETIARIWRQVLGINRIGINDNFFQIGGDSLNAVMVVSMIGRQATFADLYNHPTVGDLAAALQQKDKAGSNNKYLLRLSGQADSPKRNIICFPYGGGSGTIYKDLADAIHNHAKQYCVYTVNLPGHDWGCDSNLQPNEIIAAELVKEIKATVEGEIIMYGHCVGSALTLATANLLQRDKVAIKAIFLGAIMPPAKLPLLSKQFDPWKLVSDRNIMHFLGKIGLPKMKVQKEYRDVLIQSFRHDVKNYYRYFSRTPYIYQEKLSIPIRCIVGDKDLMTRHYKVRYKRWAQYANWVKLYTIKDAKHYFIKTNADEVAMILTGLE